ncbi:hypothetical protein Tsubulata_031148 [Turnera subulata]|uniref:Cotton fiber protein n=1 Tax=Turnera subulata TaxID=218843 RepID=A0A9Q0JQG9_9ROSI|nr:hypothetical protein Tsubulata_031148 [Turnera subulata]
MPRKRIPIFHKVSNLLKTSLLVTKIRKPIIPKLVFLKKARKIKRFRLLKHYNYGFLEEYEFSPSSSPLIHFQKKHFKKTSNTERMYSMLFLCRCLGGLRAGGGGGDELGYRLSMDSLPAIAMEYSSDDHEPLDSGNGEDSVDQRAERFIERFYQQMRMQRQESI